MACAAWAAVNRARELYERLGFRVVAKEPTKTPDASRAVLTVSWCGRFGGMGVIADESTRGASGVEAG